jgi:hypothetical protein
MQCGLNRVSDVEALPLAVLERRATACPFVEAFRGSVDLLEKNLSLRLHER